MVIFKISKRINWLSETINIATAKINPFSQNAIKTNVEKEIINPTVLNALVGTHASLQPTHTSGNDEDECQILQDQNRINFQWAVLRDD